MSGIVNVGSANEISVTFGQNADNVVVGKFAGSTKDVTGIYRPASQFFAIDIDGNGILNTNGADSLISGIGNTDSRALVADWNGDGFDEVATWSPSEKIWEIDSDGDGLVDKTSGIFGSFPDSPCAGDWNGDGDANIGYFTSSTGQWILDMNEDLLFRSADDSVFPGFGQKNDIALCGDWNTNRAGDEVAVYRPSTSEFLVDMDFNGSPEKIIKFGQSGMIPIPGDYDGDSELEVGVYDGITDTFYLDSNGDETLTSADTEIRGTNFYGIPIVGDFDGNAGDEVGIFNLSNPTASGISSIIPTSAFQLTEGTAISRDSVTCDDDDDIDGICDEWVSTNKIEFSFEGATHTQLCRPLLVDNSNQYNSANSVVDSTIMGVDVCPKNNHKQIFIEVDYMVGHKPNQQAMEEAIIAFRDSPVSNIDGNDGIDLFIELDEAIPHKEVIPFTGTDADPGFDQIKESHFGTVTQRAAPDAIGNLGAKYLYHHYALFAHNNPDDTTGIGEVGGNDFMITLGNADDQVGTTIQQKGTFIHEFGHNLFLNHGGDVTDVDNFKPNYLSVMNYAWQLGTDGDLGDLSRERLLDLDENNLNENNGIEASIHPTLGSLNTIVADLAGVPIVYSTGAPIDFDGDDILETSVAVNINYFAGLSPASDATVLSVLEGHNDWANIKLTFRDEGTFEDGIRPPASLLGEISIGQFNKQVGNSVAKLLDEVIALLNSEEIPLTTDPIVEKLEDAKIALNANPPDFSAALTFVEEAREDITGQGFTNQTEIEQALDSAIEILQNATTPAEDADHDSPIANDQTIFIRDSNPVTVNLTGSDPNGENLSYIITSLPAAGLFQVNGDGTQGIQIAMGDTVSNPDNKVMYIPGTTREDSFGFKVNNGLLDSLQAVVTLIQNSQPKAFSQNVILEGAGPLGITLQGLDSDGDELEFIPGSPLFGSLGSVSQNPPYAANVDYSPSSGFGGIDIFTFTAFDGYEGSSANINVIVAGNLAQIFVKDPPSSNNPGEQTKPVIAFNDNSPIDIIVKGSPDFPAANIDATTAWFGMIGDETTGTQDIHLGDPDFDSSHLGHFTAPGVAPNPTELTDDGEEDLILHFSQDDIGVDPINNDINGEQIVCLLAFAEPVEGTEPIQFRGCLSVTVGDKEGGGGDPGTNTELTQSEIDEAILQIQAIQGDINDLNDSKIISNKDKNKLIRQLDKAIDSLIEFDSGTALFQLSVFETLAADLLSPENAQPLIDDSNAVAAFITSAEND
jgi:hypothetical protein